MEKRFTFCLKKVCGKQLKINIGINESHSLELWSWLFEPGGQLQELEDQCALLCELVFRTEVWWSQCTVRGSGEK